MQISPVGRFREKIVVATKKEDTKRPQYPDYNSYLVAECLKRKIEPEEFMKYKFPTKHNVKDGDEVWTYDDNKVPLCGEIGIALIRNGMMIEKRASGRH